MDKEKLFLILDIDGTLLEAEGYRAACIDTINDFLKQYGQPFLKVTREITDAFEAAGITAEWDMVPLVLAALVNWYCILFPGLDPRVGCIGLPDYDLILNNEGFLSMLIEMSKTYKSMLNPDETPINAVYHYLQKNDGKGLEHLWALPYRDEYFVDTLNPWKCPFFAQLMNRLLGSERFSKFYDMPEVLSCESYLETKDKLLISDEYRRLLPEIAGDGIYPVIMTYRPTVLPEVAGNKSSQYFVNTPEGECALRLLGWDDGRMPMIGAGSLCYIEEKYNLRREYYVKPHPFHAIASMVMSLCRDEIEALEIARQICESKPSPEQSPLNEWLARGECFTLAVFEDSVSGIESVKNAAVVLSNWGYDVKISLNGIHSTDAKDKLLSAVGADLFPNINVALDRIKGLKMS